jgi:Domain of Unknown Function (DUF1080)
MKVLAAMLLLSTIATAQEWRPLFNGKNTDGWETRGDCIWTVRKDGTLVGLRPHPPSNPFGAWPVERAVYREWAEPQAWLYTKAEFDEFDLHVEYWIPPGGNSGVSIRDTSRGRWALVGPEHDAKRTPSHIGYEIQIVDGDAKYPSGSVYLLAGAKTGFEHKDDWNSLDIESRRDRIRVRLNGESVAETPGDPERSKTGPIGLQLHDRYSWAMFRNIKIREIKK